MTIAFVTVVGQNNGYRHTINVQSGQQECRSRAATFADGVGAEMNITLNQGLAALARGESLEPYTNALDVEGRNYRLALRARDAAVDLCNKDPHYEIPVSVLLPVPSIPAPGG